MTDVTDDGLAVLKEIPKLRSLAIEWDPEWGRRLRELGFNQGTGTTDAGLVHLKELTNLEKLYFSGDWASEEAIAELREALPNCKITVFEDTD